MDENKELTEAVCIHTRKIYDSCRDRDCAEDLRVYPTVSSQPYIESALSIRPSAAVLLYADVNVDEISFNRGYYTVDVTYFYEVSGTAFPGENRVNGLCVFNKRAMLFGSEGTARVFTSEGDAADSAAQPVAVVECVDPIVLSMRLADACPSGICPEIRDIPESILDHFGEELVTGDTARMLFSTLGQFSLIRLERDSQLVVPVYDYCLPDKDCPSGTEDDPCAMFSRIDFPLSEFFPPDSLETPSDYRSVLRETKQ